MLTFFTTGYGVLVIGLLAGVIFAFWNWRLALPLLVLIQIATATLFVTFHADRIEPRWMSVQCVVLIICCGSLALSAMQTPVTAILRRVDVLWMRVLMLLLIITAWQLLQIDLPIPLINPAVRRLCMWLAAIAIALLSTRNDPMTVCVALLLWAIPAHAIMAVLTRSQQVLALFGLLELALTLACSYLILLDRNPAWGFTSSRRTPPPEAPPPTEEAPQPAATGVPLRRLQSLRRSS